MKILTYRQYNEQLSNGFESLPVYVGKRGAELSALDFKVVKSCEEFESEASMVQVKTKKQVVALLEAGNVQVQKRSHNWKTEVLCYLVELNDSDLELISDVKSINPSPAGKWIMGQNPMAKP